MSKKNNMVTDSEELEMAKLHGEEQSVRLLQQTLAESELSPAHRASGRNRVVFKKN